MFFRKKSGKRDENMMFLRSLDGRHIKYATVREPSYYGETIIGRDGYINVHNDELTIICNNKIVFRKPLSDIEAGELMSLDGITLRHKDEDTGENRTVIAYYKYYRK